MQMKWTKLRKSSEAKGGKQEIHYLVQSLGMEGLEGINRNAPKAVSHPHCA